MLRLIQTDNAPVPAAEAAHYGLTDAQAQRMLPPYPLARATYRTYRDKGATPVEALLTLLEEWAGFRHLDAA